jgi:ubiquitin C-terminal hydrolase
LQLDASKQMSFAELPLVLILQLKRFAYDPEMNEFYKNSKPISFPKQLVIHPSLLSHAGVAPTPAERTYALTSCMHLH